MRSVHSPRPRQGGRARALAVVAVLAVAATASSARAGDDSGSGTNYYAQLSCAQLWHERNAILARHGYCFRSQRALATFGNPCRPPYGKLPVNLAGVVAHIRSWEQRRGCS